MFGGNKLQRKVFAVSRRLAVKVKFGPASRQ
jgi:hypothetical protein